MARKLENEEIAKVTGGASITEVGTYYFVIEYTEHGTGADKTFKSKNYSEYFECADAMNAKISQIESDGSYVITQDIRQN